jgi:hypothetical protein
MSNQVNIAHVDYGYKNRDLVNMITDRGTAISTGYVKDLASKEAKLNQYIRDNKDQLQQPVTAFIIFNKDEDYELCVEYLIQKQQDKSHKDYFIFEGENMKFKEAPEPSEVIWENLQFTKEERHYKSGVAVTIVFSFLAICFLIFASLKGASAKNSLKFMGPKNQCDIILEEVGGNVKTFFEYAKHDRQHTDEFQGLGFYKCFCSK